MYDSSLNKNQNVDHAIGSLPIQSTYSVACNSYVSTVRFGVMTVIDCTGSYVAM